jgi:hypothetical protein
MQSTLNFSSGMVYLVVYVHPISTKKIAGKFKKKRERRK